MFTVEAHYLTTQDKFSPKNPTDHINGHLALSCLLLHGMGYNATADCSDIFVPGFGEWTPPEGGGERGIGARRDYFPSPQEEMFQGNFYYTSGELPKAGTRYLITNPVVHRSIIASFGYEIGPESPEWLGGLTTEAHYFLDGYYNQTIKLEIGRAADQTLPFGPIDCP